MEQYLDYLYGKDFKKLEVYGLAYFKLIEEFFHVLNVKNEKLVKMTGFRTLKMPKQVKYELTDQEKFIKELEDILDFSLKQKKILLFLSGTFWKK